MSYHKQKIDICEDDYAQGVETWVKNMKFSNVLKNRHFRRNLSKKNLNCRIKTERYFCLVEKANAIVMNIKLN